MRVVASCVGLLRNISGRDAAMRVVCGEMWRVMRAVGGGVGADGRGCGGRTQAWRTDAGVADGRGRGGDVLLAGRRGVPGAWGRGGRVRSGQGCRGGSAGCGAESGGVDYGYGLQLSDRARGRRG